ncbi:hypothetical protein N9N67_04500 [Bacteriovoracaceae bacterium]|nr:hypothetical protein [Bacteriovoracaceae bacterium]
MQIKVNKSVTTQFIFICIWSIGIISGLVITYEYSLGSGEKSQLKSSWPNESSLKFNPGKYNLVMFLHPECTCSKASLFHFKEILSEIKHDNLDSKIIFTMPKEKEKEWINSALVKEVKEAGSIQLIFDQSSEEFKRFDAKTSGQAFLFSPSKDLLFNGGITDSRGHIGYNQGEDFIINTLNKRGLASKDVDVFGCDNLNKTIVNK